LVAANVYYLVHFPVTVIALSATFFRDRHGTFVTLRNSLIAVTSVALLLYALVQLDPPRMLPGFIDGGLAYGPDPYSFPGIGSANQFAAMPSMHVAWAVLVAVTVWRSTRICVSRFLAAFHPLVTTFVVLITAHHFATDVIVGAGLAGAALCWPAMVRKRGGWRGVHATSCVTETPQCGVSTSVC